MVNILGLKENWKHFFFDKQIRIKVKLFHKKLSLKKKKTATTLYKKYVFWKKTN